ncbi:ArsR/SmtB family transcription factor [Rhizobium giardinii]|uniref:ArsR/SmtB family transcription factor n=1 Tax=Rhizobium giardinii TaxID=56731 RepID=UPI000DD62CB8
MVEYLSPLDAVFHALSDPTRRAMLKHLCAGEQKVGDLAAPFDMSLAAASKHVKVLEAAGLLRREVRGRAHVCRLDVGPMHAGLEWMRYYEKFWNAQLDTLEEILNIEDSEKEKKS